MERGEEMVEGKPRNLDPTSSSLESASTPIPFEALARLDPRSISAFSRRLKHNSYAIILLPEKIAEDVVNTQKELQRYFRSTGLEDKHKHTLDANDFRYGYWFSPKMGKELFQVRRTEKGARWPSDQIRKQCETCFEAMHYCGEICLMALGGFLCRSQSARNANVSRRERDSKSDGVEAASSVPSLSSSKEGACFWRNLCKGCTPQDFPLSASLLDIFRYYGAPARGADSCSAHTDYNLLTLVPRALGKAGLEVFGWKSGEWEPVEGRMKSFRECVVMAGESLPPLTANWLSASIHRVVLPLPKVKASSNEVGRGREEEVPGKSGNSSNAAARNDSSSRSSSSSSSSSSRSNRNCNRTGVNREERNGSCATINERVCGSGTAERGGSGSSSSRSNNNNNNNAETKEPGNDDEGDRISTPFLLFANPEQRLTCSPDLRPEFLGPRSSRKQKKSERRRPPSSDEFVCGLLREKESVTFGKKYQSMLWKRAMSMVGEDDEGINLE